MSNRVLLIFVIVIVILSFVALRKDTRPDTREKGMVTASVTPVPTPSNTVNTDVKPEPAHQESRVVGNWIWLNPGGGVKIVLNADKTGSLSGGPDADFNWESQGETGFQSIVKWKDQGYDRTSRFYGELSNGKLVTNWTIFGFGKNLSTTFEPSDH